MLSRALGCNFIRLEALHKTVPTAKCGVPVPPSRWRVCSTRLAMTPLGDNMKKKQGREDNTRNVVLFFTAPRRWGEKEKKETEILK